MINNYPPPEGLNEEHQKIWYDFIERVSSAYHGKVYTFEQALFVRQRAEEIRKVIEKEGMTIESTRGNMPHAHPLLRAEKDARTLFCRLWKELGLNYRQSEFRDLKTL